MCPRPFSFFVVVVIVFFVVVFFFFFLFCFFVFCFLFCFPIHLKSKYHRTDAMCAQQPTTLTSDLHVKNQPVVGFMPSLPCIIIVCMSCWWYASNVSGP